MRVELLDGVTGARTARGVVVIIDVFRACSVACYAMAQGAHRIIPVRGIKEALQLKRENREFFAVGERYGRKLPGFDCGNSPTELAECDVRGKTIVHTTHSGTQGLASSHLADVVLTGSLVNATAVCRYISALAPERVSLVRMGIEARERSDADAVCAEWLAACLSDKPYEAASIRERLQTSPEAQKFFDPAADWAPMGDFELCTALDRFDFVLRLADGAGGRRSLIAIPQRASGG